MLESKIQKKIITHLEQHGWYVIKLIKTNKNGVPDLVVIDKNGGATFIEVKRPGGKLSELQKYRIKEMQSKGIKVIVAYSIEDLKGLL